MVTDRQVRKLMKLLSSGEKLSQAADKSGMDEKTARKYHDGGRLPSEMKVEHDWRTREDPFGEVWEGVKAQLEMNSGLEAKTLFEWLLREHPGEFQEGQLRTLQRRVKFWRATDGPEKEVYFTQEHHPGVLCQSDFTSMTGLGIRLAGQPFAHLLYHFVLPYSNWETGTICFSESFESLSEGLQNALWELGGVPEAHQSDRLSAAVHKVEHPEEFTRAYRELLDHYGLAGRKIQAGKAHENGDVEQRHYRFKRALDQALRLRGTRDFRSREEYETFLRELMSQLNAGRRVRLQKEHLVLRRLPDSRLAALKRLPVKVGPSSTIRVQHNVYSVPSRLIGERVEVRLYAERLEVWYGQKLMETMPRLRGRKQHRINYRHIIHWLVRKPGAFTNYRYRDELFPGSQFRLAYDRLQENHPGRAHQEYLGILELAAQEGENLVRGALKRLADNPQPLSLAAVAAEVGRADPRAEIPVVRVAEVDLSGYDQLLTAAEVN